MDDYYDYEENDLRGVHSSAVQPQKYNIVLTRDGDEIDFEFAPGSADLITRFGYIIPHDERCKKGLVNEDEDLYERMKPVLGSTFEGEMNYHTRKQIIISLHDTAILGYQRQSLIDPRISNEVAYFWEIYLDTRIFPQAEDMSWRNLMAEIITCELEDDDADRKLAEDIKDRLLEQTSK